MSTSDIEDFQRWLGTQTGRNDQVGVLARDWMTAPCCHRHGSVSSLREHLKVSHRADERVLRSLSSAVGEYRQRFLVSPMALLRMTTTVNGEQVEARLPVDRKVWDSMEENVREYYRKDLTSRLAVEIVQKLDIQFEIE